MDSAELFLAMHGFQFLFSVGQVWVTPLTRFCHVSVPVTLTETRHYIFNPSKEILGEYFKLCHNLHSHSLTSCITSAVNTTSVVTHSVNCTSQ